MILLAEDKTDRSTYLVGSAIHMAITEQAERNNNHDRQFDTNNMIKRRPGGSNMRRSRRAAATEGSESNGANGASEDNDKPSSSRSSNNRRVQHQANKNAAQQTQTRRKQKKGMSAMYALDSFKSSASNSRMRYRKKSTGGASSGGNVDTGGSTSTKSTPNNPNSRQRSSRSSGQGGRSMKSSRSSQNKGYDQFTNQQQQQQQLQQPQSPLSPPNKDGSIDIIVGGKVSATTKLKSSQPHQQRQQQHLENLFTKSSSAMAISPRLHNDLQTRRRVGLDVQTVYNEDGSVECDVPSAGLGYSFDSSQVYETHFSSNVGFADIEAFRHNMKSNSAGSEVLEGDEIGSIETKETSEFGNSTLGKNGWHRVLNVVTTNKDDTSSWRGIKSMPSISEAPSTLDQLTVTHLLQNVQPQVDEYDAIYEEYTYLKNEIKALEKDRVQLEQIFHTVGREYANRGDKSSKEQMSYQSFRTNLRYMKSEDMKSLPVMWLEDVPLSSPDTEKESTNRKVYAKLDKSFQEKIRNHRGIGLALLVADSQCKTSLIGRCYMNSNYGIGHHMSPSAMLKREQAATLIDKGGEWLKHCAITGFDKANNSPKSGSGKSKEDSANNTKEGTDDTNNNVGIDSTAYFLKFDSGKTHHRGGLPSNLVARLFRERRDKSSIKYLSTGTSYSIGGGHRCYYAEFDTGECWWGTNQDNELDKVFMEIDVHRVAFGGKSSWVVIGKDGSVKWKNVPQGLHNVLIAHELGLPGTLTPITMSDSTSTAEYASPCEVSLGIGGTYFLRFLDGRVDYSLPNFVADVFDKFEADGKLIRNVSLHVDTYDCLIRYSTEGLEF